MSAFPERPDCELPEVPPIPDDLVQKCEVPTAPDPIAQSESLPPFEIPPAPGCAEIITSVNFTSDSEEDPRFDININYRDNDYCFPEWEFDINLPLGGCSDGSLLNQSASPVPAGGAIMVTSHYNGGILRGTKPNEDNLLNVVFATEPIEPGTIGPIVYGSGSGCSTGTPIRVNESVNPGDSLGTVADSWGLQPGGTGFIALSGGSSSAAIKPSSTSAGKTYVAVENQVGTTVNLKELFIDGTLGGETIPKEAFNNYTIKEGDTVIVTRDADGKEAVVRVNHNAAVYEAVTDADGGSISVRQVNIDGSLSGPTESYQVLAD